MNPSIRKSLLTAVLGMMAIACLAFQPPATEPLPDFDLRPATLDAASDNTTPLQVSRDAITGAPRLVKAQRGFLTGPGGLGKNVSAKSLAAVTPADPHRALKAFLNEHAALYGHGAEVLDAAAVTRDFTTAHNGLRTTVWQQQVDGIPVFESLLIAHVTKKGELVNVASQFIPNPAAAAGKAARAFAQATPSVTASQSICLAANNLGATVAETNLTATAGVGAEQKQSFTAPELRGPATTRLVWLPLSATKLALCWEVVLTSRAHAETFQILVDAQTGEALRRHCLTDYISDATYNVFTSDSPSPFSPGWQTPQSDQPATNSRTLVTFSALDTNASPAGWIDNGGNETLGNNVDAHTDSDNNDIADLPRPQGAPSRMFDFPLDLDSDPTNSSAADVVQLFYWCNFMHDKLYELGFTEAVGNFQSTNFGRGGYGDDAVQADAQDGGGFNNANMTTDPNDGAPPRMQMYLFDGSAPHRDGSLDAEIVLHEYTHGLSDRLVGGGAGISDLQTGGMGEGWSDFYALSLLSEPGDNPDAAYAFGGYATFQFYGLQQNYYYGIRRYPYSTDLTKNPLTFKDIDPAQASPHTGVPRSPVIVNTANEVHNMGELWCVTLWEARAKLIAKYGDTNGNWLMLQLVTEGMKLGPANPNFLEARDAILQADEANNEGANLDELWAAFAKRGMGLSATSPASYTASGVIEAFDVPDDLQISPSNCPVAKGPVGGPFTVTNWIFTFTNVGEAALDWMLAGDTNWLALATNNGNLATGVTDTVTASLTDAATNLAAGVYTARLFFTNTTSSNVQHRDIYLAVGQPNDYFTELFGSNSFDLDHSSVTFTPDASINFYSACRTVVSNFPTPPAGGVTLAMGDDSYATITLTGTNSVALYHQRTNVFYLCSNGYLTFDAEDTTNTFFYGNTFADHFSRARVAALLQDWNPAAGGSITKHELADRIALTYVGVPEYYETTPNDFQIEMFYDGRIRLTWLTVNHRNGLVGLSMGQGVPVGFAASDLSANSICPDVPLHFLPLQLDGDTLRIQIASAGGTALEGAQAERIRFFSTTNLDIPFNDWTLVTNPLVFTNGVLELEGLSSTNAEQQFFRARQNP